MVGTAQGRLCPPCDPGPSGAAHAALAFFAGHQGAHHSRTIPMPSPIRPSQHPSRRSLLIGGAAFGALSLSPRHARAQAWPARPVKLMVPFAAGGTTDLLARIVAAKISEEYGQQFVVENKA